MISKKINLNLILAASLFLMGVFTNAKAETVEYNYQINIATTQASYGISQIRKFSPEVIIKSALPKAENGDVIAQWLLVDSYSRSGQWDANASKWVFIATMNLLMDASICSDPDDTKYAIYHINALFGNSVLSTRMYPNTIRKSLTEARDYILSKHWVAQPAYFPTEICTDLSVEQKRIVGASRYKKDSDWEALRSKAFEDFLRKGKIDAIPEIENSKKYEGPTWIK